MKLSKSNLFPHWLIVGGMFLSLLIYHVISRLYGHELIAPLPEPQRVMFRSIFYILAIIGFPITNLIRHIQIRLNQTMPGEQSASSRYLLTVLVSMIMMESIGAFGFVMFILGDDFNTLYIFTGLAALGCFLYRPKQEEYDSIIESLFRRQ